MMDELGQVERDGENGVIRFERLLDAPIDRVWAALTSERELGAWMAPATLDLRVGGEVVIAFEVGDTVRGTIRELDPPHTLAFTWTFPGEDDALVRFDLSEHEGGTRLRLRHSIKWEHARGYGAGWHAYLGRLTDVLAGREVRGFMEVVQAVLPRYLAEASGGAG